MVYQWLHDTLVIRLDRGEEVVTSIENACQKSCVRLGTVSAIGAVDHAVVGLYRVEEQEYHSNTFDMPLEIVGLTGNVTTKEGKVYLHLHAALADETGRVVGGHLNEARVSATCEIFIRRLEGEVERVLDPSIGLNVLDLPDSQVTFLTQISYEK